VVKTFSFLELHGHNIPQLALAAADHLGNPGFQEEYLGFVVLLPMADV
jgi:hypothetical protein